MQARLQAACAAITCAAAMATAPAHAAAVNVSFTALSGTTGVDGTAVYMADLSGLSIGEIQSIKLTDSNSGLGGSPGAFSGFDLDAIKLSTSSATTAAEASAAAGLGVFDFSPAGTFFSPGSQRAPADAKLHGTDASGMQVDPLFATLDSFDAVYFGIGSVTLGDGGSIIFNLTTALSTAGPLYLYVGEVSGDPGETLDGLLTVSSDPFSVPEPASAALVGIAAMAAIAARRRRAVHPSR